MNKKIEDDFGVYLCYKERMPFRTTQKIVVLAVDFQAALSTVPDATGIERVDGDRTPVVINKSVLKMLERKAGSKKRTKK